MNWKKHSKILRWTPRVLAIILCIMVLALGLDVFDMQSSWINMFIGFLIHSIPAYILIGNTVAAWKKPLIGGCIFVGLGMLYLIMSRGRFFGFGMIPIATGALFIAQHYLLIHKK